VGPRHCTSNNLSTGAANKDCCEALIGDQSEI